MRRSWRRAVPQERGSGRAKTAPDRRRQDPVAIAGWRARRTKAADPPASRERRGAARRRARCIRSSEGHDRRREAVSFVAARNHPHHAFARASTRVPSLGPVHSARGRARQQRSGRSQQRANGHSVVQTLPVGRQGHQAASSQAVPAPIGDSATARERGSALQADQNCCALPSASEPVALAAARLSQRRRGLEKPPRRAHGGIDAAVGVSTALSETATSADAIAEPSRQTCGHSALAGSRARQRARRGRKVGRFGAPTHA